MKIVNAIRSAAAKARASVPWGAYIPNNKVLAGALAAAISLALTKLGVVDIPAAYVSVGAFAVVSYLFPESPVAAAHVVAKAAQPVRIQRQLKRAIPVRIGDTTAFENQILARNAVQLKQSVTKGDGPTVPPQTA